MFGFSTDVMMSLLRQLLSVGGAVLVTKGLATGDQISAAVSAVVVLVSVVWSITHHKLANDSAKPLDVAKP